MRTYTRQTQKGTKRVPDQSIEIEEETAVELKRSVNPSPEQISRITHPITKERQKIEQEEFEKEQDIANTKKTRFLRIGLGVIFGLIASYTLLKYTRTLYIHFFPVNQSISF